MATASEILNDPAYTNANEATKQAIFDRHVASDTSFVDANAATQAAIRQRFGIGDVSAQQPIVQAVPKMPLEQEPATGLNPVAPIPTALVPPVPEKEASALGQLVGGAKQVASDYKTALQSLGSQENANQAALAELQREQEIGQEVGHVRGIPEVKKAYGKEGVLGASKEVGSQIPGAIAGSGAQMATTIGGNIIGGLTTRNPLGAYAGGFAALYPQFYMQNLASQADEQTQKGEPVNVNRGKAATAAAVQAGLEEAGVIYAYGKNFLKAVVGKVPVTALEKQVATKSLVESAKSVLGSVGKGTLRTAAEESFVNPSQTLLDRWQSGQDLFSKEAMEQYGADVYGSLLQAPLGSAAGFYEVHTARKKLAEAGLDWQGNPIEGPQPQSEGQKALSDVLGQVSTQPATTETPQPNVVTPEQILSHATTRLQELEIKANGKPAQETVDENGNKITIPEQGAQPMTEQEISELKFLQEHQANPEKLAAGYGVTIGAPTVKGSQDTKGSIDELEGKGTPKSPLYQPPKEVKPAEPPIETTPPADKPSTTILKSQLPIGSKVNWTDSDGHQMESTILDSMSKDGITMYKVTTTGTSKDGVWVESSHLTPIETSTPAEPEVSPPLKDENGFITNPQGQRYQVFQHTKGSWFLNPYQDIGAFAVINKGQDGRPDLNLVLNKEGKLVPAGLVLENNKSNGTAFIAESEEQAAIIMNLLEQRATTIAGSEEYKAINEQLVKIVKGTAELNTPPAEPEAPPTEEKPPVTETPPTKVTPTEKQPVILNHKNGNKDEIPTLDTAEEEYKKANVDPSKFVKPINRDKDMYALMSWQQFTNFLGKTSQQGKPNDSGFVAGLEPIEVTDDINKALPKNKKRNQVLVKFRQNTLSGKTIGRGKFLTDDISKFPIENFAIHNRTKQLPRWEGSYYNEAADASQNHFVWYVDENGNPSGRLNIEKSEATKAKEEKQFAEDYIKHLNRPRGENTHTYSVDSKYTPRFNSWQKEMLNHETVGSALNDLIDRYERGLKEGTFEKSGYINSPTHDEPTMYDLENKKQAEMYLDIMKHVVKIEPVAKAHLYMDPNRIHDTDGQVIAFYNSPRNYIAMFTNGKMRDFMHEVVHAATVHFVKTNPNHPLVKKLEKLLEASRKKDKKIRGKYQLYGNTNTKEFLAEGFSNPQFIKHLMDINPIFETTDPTKAGGLWDNLKEIIREMIGQITGKPYPNKTAFSELMDISGEMFTGKTLEGYKYDIGHKGEKETTSSKQQIESPAFKKWFGNSIVTEPYTNKPRVMYHGTIGDFDTFMIENKKNRAGNPDAHYFTNNPQEASDYTVDWRKENITGPKQAETGANVMPVYLRLENPFDIANGKNNTINQAMLDQFKTELKKENTRSGIDDWINEQVQFMKDHGQFRWGLNITPEAQTRILKAGGYDGIVDGTHRAVFNANQVKSAIGNKGTYKLDSDVITESRGPLTEEDISLNVEPMNEQQAQEDASVSKKQTDTPAFKKWFGKSKIVNADGTPKLMYHGTAHDISEFITNYIFVTPDPKFANDFTKYSAGRIMRQIAKGIDANPSEKLKLITKAVDDAIANKKLGTKENSNNMFDGTREGYIKSFMDKPFIEAADSTALHKPLTEELQNRMQTGRNIMPVYVKAENPFDFENISHVKKIQTKLFDKFKYHKIKEGDWEAIESDDVQDAIKSLGFDSFYTKENGEKQLAVFNSNQIKSTIGNRGTFDITEPEISKNVGPMTEGEAQDEQGSRQIFNYRGDPVDIREWEIPEQGRIASLLSKWFQYFADEDAVLTKIMNTLKSLNRTISDMTDIEKKQELKNSRISAQLMVFANEEVNPIVKQMLDAGVSLEEINKYLLAKHSPAYNERMNNINHSVDRSGNIIPYRFQDRASSMSTQDANDYINELTEERKALLEDIAKKWYAIRDKTQKLLVESGQETQETIDLWNETYPFYVPLNREQEQQAMPAGLRTGSGTDVRGDFSKRATGSEKQVISIADGLLYQRERAIARAENNEVGKSIYRLFLEHPAPKFAISVNPDAIYDREALIAELKQLGYDNAEDVVDNIMAEPKEKYLRKVKLSDFVIDPTTGFPIPNTKEVVDARVSRNARFGDNVLTFKMNGHERYVFFDKKNPDAITMIRTLKQLDAQQLGWFLSGNRLITHYLAQVYTVLNPIFGIVNGIKDYPFGMVNLSTTPIRGKQLQVSLKIMPAMLGIMSMLRKERAGGGFNSSIYKWQRIYSEALDAGFQTSNRYAVLNTGEDRTYITNLLDQFKDNNTKQAFRYVINMTYDFASMIENGVRLASYQQMREAGYTPQQSASVAKNLTINFDKKGSRTTILRSLYLFFNASIQGTVRLSKTLKGPSGGRILVGGILLGVMQAVLIAAAGFKDDDPPEYIRSHNLIIPTGDGKYKTIPMPYGLNILPNTGRILMEAAMDIDKHHGLKDAHIGKHALNWTNSLFSTFSPFGNQGLSMNSLIPTSMSAPFAISPQGTNTNAFGQTISKKDSYKRPTPGYMRTKESGTAPGKEFARWMNKLTLGTDYTKGGWSPTGDDIDFLASTYLGPVLGSINKTYEYAKAKVSGEEVPSYKVPVLGRFQGETDSKPVITSRFYTNLNAMYEHEFTIKNLKNNEKAKNQYYKDHPEARAWRMAEGFDAKINEINAAKKQKEIDGAPKKELQRLDNVKIIQMNKFNDAIEKIRNQ